MLSKNAVLQLTLNKDKFSLKFVNTHHVYFRLRVFWLLHLKAALIISNMKRYKTKIIIQHTNFQIIFLENNK